MDLQLAGKTALVTGASIGIGRGIALALAREGAQLAIAARRAELLEDTAGAIVAAGGKRPVIVVEDLLAEGSPERIAEAALAGLGSVDILINNAGGSRPFKLDASEEQWQEAMTLNFTRQRQLTHRLLDQMMARKWGRIVNITGKSEPDGINGAFCAKAAVHSWAKGLSREVGKHGITVNSIPPGRIMSEQIARNYTPEYRQWQADNEIPVGRYGEPEDVANLVCYPGLAAGRLHHRHRDSRRRRPAALSVLSSAAGRRGHGRATSVAGSAAGWRRGGRRAPTRAVLMWVDFSHCETQLAKASVPASCCDLPSGFLAGDGPVWASAAPATPAHIAITLRMKRMCTLDLFPMAACPAD